MKQICAKGVITFFILSEFCVPKFKHAVQIPTGKTGTGTNQQLL
jgi:hypothetical protein